MPNPRAGSLIEIQQSEGRIGLRAIEKSILYEIGDIVENGIDDLGTLIASIEFINKKAQKIRIEQERKKFHRNLRLLILAVKEYSGSISDNATSILNTISSEIGTIPLLNDEDESWKPSKEYLPPDYDNSVTKWKKTPWENPNRNSKRDSSGKPVETLGFFEKTITVADQQGTKEKRRFAAVRLNLLSQNPNRSDKITSNETNSESVLIRDYAISFSDLDLHHPTNLDADHLQPSEDILNRQQELIEAMNLIPKFKERILLKTRDKGYFIIKNDRIIGSKYFYIAYHNCLLNIMLIDHRSNIEKSSRDPVEWLENNKYFGKNFFDAMGGKDKINKAKILYTHNNRVFGYSVKSWMIQKYIHEIFQVIKLNNVIDSMRDKIFSQPTGITSHSRKRKKIQITANMGLLEGIGELTESSSENTDSSFISDEDQDIDIIMNNEKFIKEISTSLKSDIEALKKKARKLVKQKIMSNIPKIKGLRYQKIPGDGHCFFHAIALYLGENQQSLRRTVADYIRNHIEEFAEFIPGDIETHLNELENGLEWADNVEIEVAMRAFNRPILIVTPERTIRNPEDRERFDGDSIFVYYNPAILHYDALLPREGFDATHVLNSLTNLEAVEAVTAKKRRTP